MDYLSSIEVRSFYLLVGYDCVLGFYNLFFTMISMLKTNGKIMFVGQIGSYH